VLIDLSFINQFVHENCERVTVSQDGTHFHARCPLCGDSKKSLSKKRFHVDWSPARCIFQCFNCGESGNFLQLYAKINHISNSEAYKILHKFDYEDFKKSLQRPSGKLQHTKTNKIKKVSCNYILEDCINKQSEGYIATKGLEVLKSFRSDRQIPEEYPIYFAYQGKFKNRIIIPIFENNDIVYFQARRLPGTDIQPKYINPDSEKSMVVLNESKFNPLMYIIVTEGLLDAFSAGVQATTCLGKEISDEFIELLLSKTEKGVIVAFDNDEDGIKSLKKFMYGWRKKKANKYAKKVKYFLMPKQFLQYKDINKLCTEEKISDVYDFIVKNSYDYVVAAMKLKLEER
jgi:DNA primase